MKPNEKAFAYLLTGKPIHAHGTVIYKAVIGSDGSITYHAKHPDYNFGHGTLLYDEAGTLPEIDITETEIKLEYPITYQKFASIIEAMKQKTPIMADSMKCKEILDLSIHAADTIHHTPWWGCIILDNNGNSTYQIPLQYVECSTQGDVEAVRHIIEKLPSAAFVQPQPQKGGETDG